MVVADVHVLERHGGVVEVDARAVGGQPVADGQAAQLDAVVGAVDVDHAAGAAGRRDDGARRAGAADHHVALDLQGAVGRQQRVGIGRHLDGVVVVDVAVGHLEGCPQRAVVGGVLADVPADGSRGGVRIVGRVDREGMRDVGDRRSDLCDGRGVVHPGADVLGRRGRVGMGTRVRLGSMGCGVGRRRLGCAFDTGLRLGRRGEADRPCGLGHRGERQEGHRDARRDGGEAPATLSSARVRLCLTCHLRTPPLIVITACMVLNRWMVARRIRKVNRGYPPADRGP